MARIRRYTTEISHIFPNTEALLFSFLRVHKTETIKRITAIQFSISNY